MIKNLPAMWDTCVRSLGWEDPLEIFFLCVLWEYLKIYSFIKLQVYNTVLLAMILGYINMLCIGVPELTHPKTMWGDIHVSSLDCDHFIKYKHVNVLTHTIFICQVHLDKAGKEGYWEACLETSMVVQWLKLQVPSPEGLSLIPGQGTWSPMPQLRPGTTK